MKDYRAIITRFSLPMDREILNEIVSKLSVEHVCHVCTSYIPITGLDITKQTWVSSQKAKRGIYTVDWNSLIPLDEEFIEKMRECESITMQIEYRSFGSTVPSYEVRKWCYLQHLRFWNDYIEKNNINVFFSSAVPHEPHEYVIYALCKKKGIPTIFGHGSIMRDQFFLIHDWEKSAIQIQERYNQLEGTTCTLSERYQSYFDAQTSDSGLRPWDLRDTTTEPTEFEQWKRMVQSELKKDPKKSLNKIASFFARTCTASYWQKKINTKMDAKRTKDLFAFYEASAVIPELNQRFIYVPLHMQPECSTCPSGGAFVDQQLIVEMLASLVPEDVMLYVKEHPNQQEGYRLKLFYEKLLTLKNVHLIKRVVSTADLRNNCMAVATVTGTAGFEAIFRGKPVLLFGHRFYEYAPGVFAIRTVQDAKKALQKIESGVSIDPENIRRFMKAVEDTSIHGTFHRDFEPSDTWSPSQNISSIASAYIQEIKNL